jgi:hypothetical protein
MSRLMTVKNLAIGVVLAGSLGIGGAGLALAQDEEAPAISHPAHIHAGTCDELDPNPIGPLNNIVPMMNEESEDENANAPQGVLTAAPVLYSMSEEVELSFQDDVLATSHSINVHESEENIQNYVACGEIGGVVVDGELVVALRSMNDSGYSGIAILTEDGDGNVDVEIYLAEPVETGDNVPDATPVS